MPSLTEAQNTALTLMDFLYIHDIASLSTYSVAKNEFFPDFAQKINDIAVARGHKGRELYLYQHYILCFIEIFACIPKPSEVKNYNELVDVTDRLLAKVESDVKKNDFVLDDFLTDIKELDDIYQFAGMKKELVYKLVAQYLYFEYGQISIAVFNKFLDLGILQSDRYQAKNVTEKKEYFKEIFFRAMLFIEFELYKRQLYVEINYKEIKLTIDFSKSEEDINDMLLFVKSIKQVQSQTGKYFKSIVYIDLSCKKSIVKYIKELNNNLAYNRLFFKNISNCIGLMGSWFVNYFKEINTQRATHSEPQNEVESDKKACTAEAKERMFEHGFTLHEARTFNDHYKQFCLDYRLIREYFRNFSEDQIGVMTPDIINYLFIIKNEGLNFDPLYRF